MNPIRAIRRLACILAGLAVAFAATAPAALASTSPGRTWPLSWADPPLPPGWNKHPPLPAGPGPVKYPPGWNKHPPLPAHAHALATGGMPGWQISLIAAAATVLAAAVVVLLARARAARRRAAASPA
jgi:hypothetical protein